MRNLAVALACLVALNATLPHPAAAQAAKLGVGSPAPVFSAPLLEGGELNLAPYVGKNAILLDFWSIYCVACVEEMPRLVEIYERYKDRGLVAFAVDLDSSTPKRVVKFVKGLDPKIPFPIVFDQGREVASKYGVNVLPLTVLIDRRGKIVLYHPGYAKGDEAELEAEVREALGVAK